jgi:hypothetical protein
MQGEVDPGDGHPLTGGGSSQSSSFPPGTQHSARPAFGDRTSVAIAVALMVALTLLFLPWSTIRPGLNGRGAGPGPGVGAAPSGSGPILSAPVGISGIGISAIAQPLGVTLGGGQVSHPAGPPGKHKPPPPPNEPVNQRPVIRHGKADRGPTWPPHRTRNDEGGNGHEGDGGHGHDGDGGHGHEGNGGHGNGGGGSGGWGHDGNGCGHHGDGHGHDGGHGQHGGGGSGHGGSEGNGSDGHHRGQGHKGHGKNGDGAYLV